MKIEDLQKANKIQGELIRLRGLHIPNTRFTRIVEIKLMADNGDLFFVDYSDICPEIPEIRQAINDAIQARIDRLEDEFSKL